MSWKQLLLLGVSVFLIFGCAEDDEEEAETVLTTKHYAYLGVVAPANSKVVAYEIDTTTGEVTEIEQQDAETSPLDIVGTPNGQFLYVSHFVGGIQVYSIEAETGALTLVETEDSSTYTYTRKLMVSSDSSLLYAEVRENSTSNSFIQTFSIGSDGALTSVGSATSLGFNMRDMKIDSTDENLYFIGLDGSNTSQIWKAAADTDGSVSLETLANQPNNTTYASVAAISNDDGNLYVACNNGGFAAISRLGLSDDGTLNSSDTSINNATTGAALVSHPSLDMFYTNLGNGGSGNASYILPYSIGDDGEFTAGTQVEGDEVTSYDLAIDSTGSVLLHALGTTMTTYTVDDDGVPTAVSGSQDLSGITGIIYAGTVTAVSVSY